MNFDLRIPLGLIFTLFGLILMGTGLWGGPELVRQSLGINMNLWWGVVQLLFGATMLTLALRERKKTTEARSQEAVRDPACP